MKQLASENHSLQYLKILHGFRNDANPWLADSFLVDTNLGSNFETFNWLRQRLSLNGKIVTTWKWRGNYIICSGIEVKYYWQYFSNGGRYLHWAESIRRALHKDQNSRKGGFWRSSFVSQNGGEGSSSCTNYLYVQLQFLLIRSKAHPPYPHIFCFLERINDFLRRMGSENYYVFVYFYSRNFIVITSILKMPFYRHGSPLLKWSLFFADFMSLKNAFIKCWLTSTLWSPPSIEVEDNKNWAPWKNDCSRLQ